MFDLLSKLLDLPYKVLSLIAMYYVVKKAIKTDKEK